MRQPLLIVSSLIALTACTQPAAPIAMRGQESFTKDGSFSVASNTSMAAPVQSVSNAAPFSFASNAPTQSTAPLGSSIGVSDLEPAAGKAEAKIEAKPEPKAEPKQEAKFLTPPEPKTAAKTEPKQVLSAEAAPVNAWTKKPRDTASFVSDKPAKATQYIWPVASHEVTTPFGGNGKANDGINIAAGNGEPVWAAADGEVLYADSKMQGYGKMVIVKHAGGKTTTYAHLARYAVEKYDRVKQGDIIGYVGATGSAKTPQLYFSMRDGTKAIDPQKYLDRNVAGL